MELEEWSQFICKSIWEARKEEQWNGEKTNLNWAIEHVPLAAPYSLRTNIIWAGNVNVLHELGNWTFDYFSIYLI